MKPKKLDPIIFVGAAKSISDGSISCACGAIAKEATLRSVDGHDEMKFFAMMFAQADCLYWWGIFSTPESHLARSIALLLCAEMVRDKQRKSI